MTDKITVSIRINPQLWKDAQKHAIDKDLYVGELVEKALASELKKK
jgi:hypothetical protein